MGYCTKFTLNVKDPTGKDVTDSFVQYFRENSGYPHISSFNLDGESSDSWKWYEHNDDMDRASRMGRWKDHLLQLKGIGEDEGDYWVKYFKNGKVQICFAEITYPPFDESKLK